MSEQFRCKGKFANKAKVEKHRKSIERMRQTRMMNKSEAVIKPNLCNTRRIVDLSVLAEGLKCCHCKEVLSLENIVLEKKRALDSLLHVTCKKCSIITFVPTGQSYTGKDGKTIYDITSKVVLGAVHSGIGYTALSKMLACLNMPSISKNTYSRYAQEVSPAIEEAATEICRSGVTEERELHLLTNDKNGL